MVWMPTLLNEKNSTGENCVVNSMNVMEVYPSAFIMPGNKNYIFTALAAILFGGVKLLVQILVEGITGTIRVKLFQIWSNGSGDIV